MQKFVIHGASSFVGKHFVNLLIDKKMSVVLIARETSKIDHNAAENLQIIRYNKSINELLKRQMIDLSGSIFYEFSWWGVAGVNRNNVEQFIVNIPLMISSVEFANFINAKHWISIGSQAEYGNINRKVSESDNCNPTTLYGKSKLLCSNITGELCSCFNIEHTWLRLFSVYGPNETYEWLIPSLIKNMLQNIPVDTTLGEQKWDYLYIDDLTDALFKLADSKGIGITNIGSGKPIQIKYIINKIKELTNSTSKINFGYIPYRTDQVMHMEADISKISKSLNWQPRVNIEIGLKKMIEYYKTDMVKK